VLKALLAAVLGRPSGASPPDRRAADRWIAEGRLDEAIAEYRRVVAVEPGDVGARAKLASLLHRRGHLDAAARAYEEVLADDPGRVNAIGNLLRIRRDQCDWAATEPLRDRLLDLVASARDDDAWLATVDPFLAVTLPLPPADCLRVARHRAARIERDVAATPVDLPRRITGHGERIRVGYVSADFHDHATAHLTLGLYRRHDRRRFEVHGYSIGAADDGPYRRRIRDDCDRFSDLAARSDAEIAQRIAADGIDILVDLKGYTKGDRPGIFARRPAPVQVQYLGFPGTMGASFIDYLVCDAVVAPPGDDAHFSERLVRLEGSYQVNDREQAIDADGGDRARHGLPANAFVYCSFNRPYKIDREAFDCWMRILQRTPGSVLWLYAEGPAAENLRRAAAAHGVDPARLVFGSLLRKPQHLARLRLADLFLDTFTCNAHTSASDALWAGVPVVTRRGNAFATRVGESLLRATGLPELVAGDTEGYEALAVRHASDAAWRLGIRSRLAHARDTAPLFDTDRTARQLDAAYAEAWRRHLAGEPPASFEVPDPAAATIASARGARGTEERPPFLTPP